MMVELKNKRLAAIAELVPPCDTVADIGTDHALLPASLAASGRCRRAIACDVRSGPLLAAEKTIGASGLSGRIETRLGFGLETLAPGECECIVIAGMGGLLIREILERSPAVAGRAERLILQPNTCIYELRQYLASAHYEVIDERGVLDAGHAYLIIVCRSRAAGSGKTARTPESAETAEKAGTPDAEREALAYWLGGIMPKRRNPDDRAYLRCLREKAAHVLSGMERAEGPLGGEKAERRRQYEAVARAIDALLADGGGEAPENGSEKDGEAAAPRSPGKETPGKVFSGENPL